MVFACVVWYDVTRCGARALDRLRFLAGTIPHDAGRVVSHELPDGRRPRPSGVSYTFF
jgi:hypothetical protein